MSIEISSKSNRALAPEVEEELRRFEAWVAALQSGKLDPNEFKKFRLNNGVYGIRGETDRHMIRIKCPHGEISADQLDVVAEMTERFTRTKLAHVTTRQAIQIHHVPLNDVATVLRRLNESGLTTREACGNTARNVTKSPFSGLLADEVFDVTPFAEAVFLHLLRNPLTQNLPRKFKVSFFGGGSADWAYTAINDLGFVAARRMANGREEKGFRVYVGGGLGATPHLGILLEEFTPLDDFFPTVDAVVRVFDRHGDRKDKFHARLKFVLQRLGPEPFKKMVLDERVAVRATRPGGWKWILPTDTAITPPSVTALAASDGLPESDFEMWRKTNVFAQKQAGYSLSVVVTPLGDISVPQMRTLASIARRYNGGQLRTMVQQNFVLPWVRAEHQVALHRDLKKAGLSTAGALRLSDVTRCPGADTCQIAITKSRGLASALLELFSKEMQDERDRPDLSIKISGCTNSCGQHHIGNIGFFGTYRKVNGVEVPHYQLLVGGDVREGHAAFGVPIAAIPARRAPAAVRRLVALYKEERRGEERFVETMARLGRDRLKTEIEPFRTLPPRDSDPEAYFDWTETETFHASVGAGECAA